jgi:hypothetical protein
MYFRLTLKIRVQFMRLYSSSSNSLFFFKLYLISVSYLIMITELLYVDIDETKPRTTAEGNQLYQKGDFKSFHSIDDNDNKMKVIDG